MDGIYELQKAEEKKSSRRENIFISYIIKAVARDQANHSQISKLLREKMDFMHSIDALRVENELKMSIIQFKDKELETLKQECEKLRILLQEAEAKNSLVIEKELIKEEKVKSPIVYNNNNNEVVATARNIIASPSKLGDLSSNLLVVSEMSDSTVSLAESTKSKVNKKRSIKKFKEATVTSFYSLRKKTKSKEKV